MSNRAFWSPYARALRKLFRSDPTRPRSRFSTYMSMLFMDHGMFRYVYPNRFQVAEQVERQNHPPPFGVARAARRGIKTIINLRGENDFGSYSLSKQACERHGITMVDFRMYSRRLPRKREIREAKALFEKVEYPILMHCKAGADRAGIMSALYLLLHEGRPVEEAQKQLHWRFGHVRHTKTGILDFFLEAYAQANAREPIDFLTWVEEVYDPEAMAHAYRTEGWEKALDRLMNRE